MSTQSQREYEAWIRRRRMHAHKSAPLTGGAGWSTQCERAGCSEIFITPTRQRRYCSDRCRRDDTEIRGRRNHREGMLLHFECSAPRCRKQFVPRSAEHLYCSTKCRKRAHRAAGDLGPTTCTTCGTKLLERTQRKRFCSDRCRVRHARLERRE